MTDFKDTAMGYPTSLAPTGTWPLDSRSYFESKEDAIAAAAKAEETSLSGTSMYYYGQRVAVVEDNVVTYYYIGSDKQLHKLLDEFDGSVIDAQITSLQSGKRDKVDLSVYSVTRTENTDWTWTSENKELEAALNAEGIKINFHDDNIMWNAVADPSGWAFAPAPGTKSDLSVVMYFIKGPEWIDQYPATATRPRYMDETLGPAKQDQQLAAVATDDAAKPADGSLMKYDAANDRFVKAEKSSASTDPANADYRDPTDNTCHKTELTEWTFSPHKDGYRVKVRQYEAAKWSYALYDGDESLDEIDGIDNPFLKSIEFNARHTGVIATRSVICTDGKKFVTQDIIDNNISVLDSKISSKIFIEDKVSNLISGNSNLSIIKISKEEYELSVASDCALCSNTLYVIDSPEIDAYGQQIKHLAEPTDLSDATPKWYVTNAIKDSLSQLSAINDVQLTETSNISAVISSLVKVKDILTNLWNGIK